MRTAMFALAVVLAPMAARAEWQAETGPDVLQPAAQVCAQGRGGRRDQSLCFGLTCEAGQALGFILQSEGDAELMVRPGFEAQVFVGSRALSPLAFQSTTPGTFAAPLTEDHLPGIERLKAGARMELRYWESDDRPPAIWRLSLRGSRKSIEALEAVCALPDFAEQDRAARLLPDPSRAVLDDMVEACGLLGGTVAMIEGYTEPFDLDGSEPMDLRVNHGQLACSAAEDMVCGPTGCLTSLWQAQPDGRYLKVFKNVIQDAAVAAPGQVRLSLQGTLCGRRNAPPCERIYELRDGALSPAPEI